MHKYRCPRLRPHSRISRIAPVLVLAATSCAAPLALSPPIPRRDPRTSELHGDRRIDELHWLRERDTPAVLAHLSAENAYTAAFMRRTASLERKLFGEMLDHLVEDDTSVPVLDRGYLYYDRTEQGRQHPIHCRRRDRAGAREEIVIDLNDLGRGESYIGLGDREISDDGDQLAYTIDTRGDRSYTLRTKDLRTGRAGTEQITGVTGVAWAADNRTLVYVVEDAAKRSFRVLRHTLGGAGKDALVYEETDERFSVSVARSRSGALLFIESRSETASEWRFIAADHPEETPRLVAARKPDLDYEVEHHGAHCDPHCAGPAPDDRFFIRENTHGRSFGIAVAPLADPRRANWKEIIAPQKDVMIEGLDVFAGHFVLVERAGGLPRIVIHDLDGGRPRSIEFEEPAFEVEAGSNPSFASAVYRYRYESFVTPPSVYEYDIGTDESRLLKRLTIPGYQPAEYVEERLQATAPDGTPVPITLVSRRNVDPDRPRPLLLEGYGAYGAPLPVEFSSSLLPLLDRGARFAMAHVRGGGELGKRWHDDGRMLRKMNTFTDFIAAAELLISTGRTAPDRLAIEGRSAGGLLVGAVINMRPDLFRVALAGMPFVDVLDTMLDPSLPATIAEYEEWGDPRIAEHYALMRKYSPYDNIRPQPYPAVLAQTSYNDSQVMYWEPAKWVARLRANNTGPNPILLHVNLDPAGHDGQSGRYNGLKERAFELAFVLGQLGIRD